MSAWGWSAQPLHYLCCILTASTRTLWVSAACTASTITTQARGVKVTQELYVSGGPVFSSVLMPWLGLDTKNCLWKYLKHVQKMFRWPAKNTWFCLHTQLTGNVWLYSKMSGFVSTNTSRQKHLVHKTLLKICEHLVSTAGKCLHISPVTSSS